MVPADFGDEDYPPRRRLAPATAPLVEDLLRAVFAPPPLAISPGERWCTVCGETVGPRGRCQRCGAGPNELVPAVEVLRLDEYRVAGPVLPDLAAPAPVELVLPAHAELLEVE